MRREANARPTPTSLWALRIVAGAMALALAAGVGWQYLNRPRLAVETVAVGFDRPTAMLAVDGELLVAEQGGMIRNASTHEPFLDLSEVVNDGDWEQGLFDMALHPDFPTDDRLFVSYSIGGDDVVVASVPFTHPTEEPTVILAVPHPSPVHNGGRLAFGPDGYLYVGLGEGGPAESPDPHGHGQNPSTLLATVVRIDIDASEDGREYAIPPDNPFVAGGGAPEVWVYGVRNPWGVSFDPETQDLWIADVGHGAHEEVNRLPAGHSAGRNLGWSRFEGDSCLQPEHECDTSGLIMPVADLPHAEGSCAVVGGHVYRGNTIPWLVGRYVFSDYCSGKIYSLDADGNDGPRVEVDLAAQPTAVEVDDAGTLHVLTYAGEVLQIVSAD